MFSFFHIFLALLISLLIFSWGWNYFSQQNFLFSWRDNVTECHKPIEANISSMSSWPFWLEGSEILRLLFFHLSLRRPNTDDWMLFFRLFAFFALSPARSAKDLFWLLTECRQVLARLFLLVRTGQWGLLGTRLWGDKAQWTFCLKVRNFLWTLQWKANQTNMLSNYYKLFFFYSDLKYVRFIKYNKAHKDEECQECMHDLNVLVLLVTFCL